MVVVMIDCSILTFQEVHYLIPTLAIAQAINAPLFNVSDKNATCWGFYAWQSFNVPIFSFDFLPLADKKIKSLKLAILHGITSDTDSPYYFAMVFEERVRRLKMTSDNIAWADDNKTQAIIVDKKESIAVTLVDLPALTRTANTLATTTSAQVAK